MVSVNFSARRQGGVGKFWEHVVDRSALDSNLQNHLPLLATLTTGKSKCISSRGGQLCASYVSVPRKVTSGHLGWIWFVQCPGLICLAARWSFPTTSAHRLSVFWTISFDFVKVCWISFSSWKSFIGFYILIYPVSTILACSFNVGVRISWE